MTSPLAIAVLLPLIFGARPPEARWNLLPSIARVDVTIMREHVVVTHDITLPRGDWSSGDLTIHFAFGATVPFAMDARLFPVRDGELTAVPSERGEAIHLDRTARTPLALIGREEMAGMNALVAHDAFTRALAPGNMAMLRIRQLVRLPAADENGDRELLVRLGAANGNPLTLARVEVHRAEGAPELRIANARLCGKEAESLPLWVIRDPSVKEHAPNEIAPVLSTRHASDDLCVRWR